MKKLLLLILLVGTLFAGNSEIEKKIYKAILFSMVPNNEVVHVFLESPNKANLFRSMKRIVVVTDLKQADIAIVEKKVDTNYRGLVFVTSYGALKRYKDKAVGGFYWQKGRPNIIFLKQNIQKHGIQLKGSLQKYVESEL